MASTGVYIANLAQFRAALRAAEAASIKELTVALKAAGKPVAARASSLAPTLSGALAGGYNVSVRATSGWIVNKVPYAAGADWGQEGKWSGFRKYGARGSRFATRAVDEESILIERIITTGLEEILSIHGWAD